MAKILKYTATWHIKMKYCVCECVVVVGGVGGCVCVRASVRACGWVSGLVLPAEVQLRGGYLHTILSHYSSFPRRHMLWLLIRRFPEKYTNFP